MNVAVLKTKAEQALSEAFEAVADKLPGGDAVKAVRAEAIGRFAAKGLPHRRVEEWKYTDLRAAQKEAFALSGAADSKLDVAALEKALGALASIEADRLVFVNGIYAPDLSQAAKNSSEVAFHSLADTLKEPGHAWLQERLADALGPKSEAVVALNTAFARDGAIVKFEHGAKPKRLVHLVFVTDNRQPVAVFTRNMVQIGDEADVVLVESHLSAGKSGQQSNTMTEISIGQRARLVHIKTTSEGSGAQHISTAVVGLGGESEYRSFQLTSDTALVRNQQFVTFEGEGAKIDLSGAFLARGSEHIDTTLVVDHKVPGCESRELFKGVLDDRAQGVFQGKIIVRPDAQKTDGKQMSQALMLSPDAEFDSKPELEIYADDVVCGHGTTSAELDPDLLFYCKSRGIPAAEARALMIQSFVGEAIEKVENDGVRDALATIAEAWLSAPVHG